LGVEDVLVLVKDPKVGAEDNRVWNEEKPIPHGAEQKAGGGFGDGGAVVHLMESPSIGKNHFKADRDGRVEDDFEAELLFGGGGVNHSLKTPFDISVSDVDVMKVKKGRVCASNVLSLGSLMGKLQIWVGKKILILGFKGAVKGRETKTKKKEKKKRN